MFLGGMKLLPLILCFLIHLHPDERSAFNPDFDEFGDYTQRTIQTLSILDDSSSTLTPCPTLMTNQHVTRTYQHDVSHEAPDFEKFRPYFG